MTVLSPWDQLEAAANAYEHAMANSQPVNDRDRAIASILTDFHQWNSQELGGALTVLKHPTQPLIGRDDELDLLDAVLERPKTPVALLLGHAGVGKTALVEEYAKRANQAGRTRYAVFALRVGTFAAIGQDQLRAQLANLLPNLERYERLIQRVLNDPAFRIILFIDEVHMLVTVFGAGTKIGGDVIKDALARAPIRVIAATTRREYDSTIAVDKPLAERFKLIELAELQADTVRHIVQNWWATVSPDIPYPGDLVIDHVLLINRTYRSDSAEPRKTLDIVEDLVSHSRRTGQAATIETVESVFKRRYGLTLAITVDPDRVYRELERRVKGQPFALYVIRRLIRSLAFRLDPELNRPIATALLTGPTGVGKTETVKAIAHTLYPGENTILFVNMPDYKTAEHEGSFRKRVAEHVRHVPNAVILLDEFEKAHPSIQDSMLQILDEGLVYFDTVNREGTPETNVASLRNAIVFCTTNAGHEIFKNDARFTTRDTGTSVEGTVMSTKTKMDYEKLLAQLKPFLQEAGFRAEMLGRFDRIVPYRALDEQTLVAIAERELTELQTKFKQISGITVIYDPARAWPSDQFAVTGTDIAVWIACVRTSATDAQAGGARNIRSQVRSLVYDSVVDAIIDHPDCTAFHVAVSQDAALYDTGALAGAGSIVVTPTPSTTRH